jgi:hypothetical protein
MVETLFYSRSERRNVCAINELDCSFQDEVVNHGRMKWPVMSGEEFFFFGDEEMTRMEKMLRPAGQV